MREMNEKCACITPTDFHIFLTQRPETKNFQLVLKRSKIAGATLTVTVRARPQLVHPEMRNFRLAFLRLLGDHTEAEARIEADGVGSDLLKSVIWSFFEEIVDELLDLLLLSHLVLLLGRLELRIEVADELMGSELATRRLRHAGLHAIVAEVEACQVVIYGAIHITQALFGSILMSSILPLFVLKTRLHALHD